MNWDELRQLWSIPGPWSVIPITQGVNNLTQVVETPEEILERIQETLTTETWLQIHADKLVNHARSWQH